ncbi:MAG: transglutaminase-like cysteine peptidase [Deltaproteobacteria bacterium]|jgi:predicted transglutaminase-like cysteine proteinase|nr:transglutaminase-like cysteine peptidase [Deltaproteobacteria bacterium]
MRYGASQNWSRRLAALGLAASLCWLPVFSGALTGLAAEALEFDKPPVELDWGQAPAPAPAKSSAGASAPRKADFKPDRLFGTVEFRSKIKNMPKWERILKLYRGRDDIDGAFTVSNRKREAGAWEKLKTRLATAGDLEKAKGVNSFFNQWPYRQDRTVYGISDYWATPDEFIKNSGDCEDYAITKFYALKQLGVDPEKMRVVILRDTIRGLDHAVLAVYTGNEVYILDNVTAMVLSHSNYSHYRPYYSVNEVYRWAHVPPMKK